MKLLSSSSLLLLLLCILCTNSICGAFNCRLSLTCYEQTSSCLKSQSGDYQVDFDLSSLTSNTDYSFSNPATGYRFNTNVCGFSNFSCPSQLIPAIGEVMNAVSGNECYALATAQLLPGGIVLTDRTDARQGVSILYGLGDPQGCSSRRNLTQIFRCNPNVQTAQITSVIGVSSSCAYFIYLDSRFACPTLTLLPRPPSSSSSMSGGSIFLIVFFVCSFVYVALGGLYNYSQGKRGVDLCIHRGFWCGTLPELVKDGVAFVLWKIGCGNVQGNCMEKEEDYAVIRDRNESNAVNPPKTPRQLQEQTLQQSAQPQTPHSQIQSQVQQPMPSSQFAAQTPRGSEEGQPATQVRERTPSVASTRAEQFPSLISPNNSRPDYFPPLPSPSPSPSSSAPPSKSASFASTPSFVNYGSTSGEGTPKGKKTSTTLEKRASISVKTPAERQPYE